VPRPGIVDADPACRLADWFAECGVKKAIGIFAEMPK